MAHSVNSSLRKLRQGDSKFQANYDCISVKTASPQRLKVEQKHTLNIRHLGVKRCNNISIKPPIKQKTCELSIAHSTMLATTWKAEAGESQESQASRIERDWKELVNRNTHRAAGKKIIKTTERKQSLSIHHLRHGRS